MAESSIQQNLEELFYKKIILYNDLRDCLNRERAHLINMDLNLLWILSEEKEEICTKIKSVRQDINSAINRGPKEKTPPLDHILAGIPNEKRDNFINLFHTVTNLKNEIEILRKENVKHVDHSLQFIDEMITVITGETRDRNIYNGKSRLSKSGKNFFLRREV